MTKNIIIIILVLLFIIVANSLEASLRDARFERDARMTRRSHDGKADFSHDFWKLLTIFGKSTYGLAPFKLPFGG